MIHEIFSNNSDFPLKLNTIGFSKDPSITKFGPGQRSLYIIHYVTKGKGYYNGNLVTKGQGFLILPGMSEEYHPHPDEPWEMVWITSSDDAMGAILEKYNADRSTMIFDYSSATVLCGIANEIVLKTNQISDSMEIAELFLRIINSHIHSKDYNHQKPNYEVYLDFCIDYIENNKHKRITVEELSTLIGVSQPYLYKIFKNRFDTSPKQYITDYKINYAKKLLTETDMSVTEIANSAGYSDILSFSKAFSAIEKISPKKYRESVKKV